MQRPEIPPFNTLPESWQVYIKSLEDNQKQPAANPLSLGPIDGQSGKIRATAVPMNDNASSLSP